MVDISYAWVDIESTGLVANLDVPLELGIKLTDRWGFPAAWEKWLIWEDTDHYDTAIKCAKEDPIVGPMHQKSGLWDDISILSTNAKLTRSEVDEAVCDFLTDNEVRWGTLGMAGNSIGSLDRPFALIHFPKLNEALGYRNIDMSSLKEICKRINPTLWDNLAPIIGDKSNADHRVLGDIDACIVEYRAYLENFLFVEDGQ